MRITKALAVSALSLAGASASAMPLDFIDFENPITAGQKTMANGSWSPTAGVTFSSSSTQSVVTVGGTPAEGFVPNDTPIPADALGEQFLTTGFDMTADLMITYDSPVGALNFDLADIDGVQDGQPETFEIRIFDAQVGGNELAFKSFTAGDPGTGDQVVTNVSFMRPTNEIWRVEIDGSAVGPRRIGIAFDNFDPRHSMPNPGALPLLGLSLCALGVARRRRSKVA